MRRNYQKAKPKIDEKPIRANEQINVPEVFLIDENGESIGNMPTAKALAMAVEADLDLVEVNPKGQPPVVKIMNLGQAKYEREKKMHKQKVLQKKVEVKVVKLTFRISAHDMETRINQAAKFLSQDNKLKLDLFLRGRERQHFDKARELMLEFVNLLKAKPDLNLEEEQPLTKQPSGFSMILVNKK
ncbi:MAG TPA: translation initiation factor IF-3 [bacterium]|nr:translation initiation factor IF-3 [bacterium]HPT29425.1 translation initiation factor IF-3 [bacterium]